ncbi:hypothetical protein HZH66_001251 [Vespula vulgaris]|uniref:Uncharacterized protein n=1 Tax=Vespula vulgaris TaxID=7454 RepID=A0A834NKG6_VESVU|nr:hypothetical protein HZH66_001251 [Vespula vulgaris]
MGCYSKANNRRAMDVEMINDVSRKYYNVKFRLPVGNDKTLSDFTTIPMASASVFEENTNEKQKKAAPHYPIELPLSSALSRHSSRSIFYSVRSQPEETLSSLFQGSNSPTLTSNILRMGFSLVRIPATP